MRLENKVAVVTGASSGMGKAITNPFCTGRCKSCCCSKKNRTFGRTGREPKR